jgi:hypothetical protein
VATTYEEAKLCPKCGKPGEVTRDLPAGRGLPKGTRVHEITCRTKLCPWEDTPWMVQVNPDGSIPPPQDHTRSPKVYVGFEGHDEAAKTILQSLQRQYEAEQHKGAELRNPFSK